MARSKTQKARKKLSRHYKPPPELANYEGQVGTPQRAAVFSLRAFAQKRGIKITRDEIHDISKVATRIQSRILASKQLRTHHNIPDNGPDDRGRKKALKQSDTAAIAAYCEDESIPLNDRGAPWETLANDSSVSLPTTYHFKTDTYEPVDARSIRQSCGQDQDIINAVCEEEKELNHNQATNRLDFLDKNLDKRPHSQDWLDVCFCDRRYKSHCFKNQSVTAVTARQKQDNNSRIENLKLRREEGLREAQLYT